MCACVWVSVVIEPAPLPPAHDPQVTQVPHDQAQAPQGSPKGPRAQGSHKESRGLEGPGVKDSQFPQGFPKIPNSFPEVPLAK
jgi:hypothetical protein